MAVFFFSPRLLFSSGEYARSIMVGKPTCLLDLMHTRVSAFVCLLPSSYLYHMYELYSWFGFGVLERHHVAVFLYMPWTTNYTGDICNQSSLIDYNPSHADKLVQGIKTSEQRRKTQLLFHRRVVSVCAGSVVGHVRLRGIDCVFRIQAVMDVKMKRLIKRYKVPCRTLFSCICWVKLITSDMGSYAIHLGHFNTPDQNT